MLAQDQVGLSGIRDQTCGVAETATVVCLVPYSVYCMAIQRTNHFNPRASIALSETHRLSAMVKLGLEYSVWFDAGRQSPPEPS